jgi:hypothetical protein
LRVWGLVVPEKHKNLKVSMRFTQKTYIRRQIKKKRGPIGVWWCQKNIKF